MKIHQQMGTERWLAALERFEAITEEEIDVLLERASAGPALTDDEWLVLAVIALDQGGTLIESSEVVTR